MSTSKQTSLLELNAIINEMVKDQWHSRESLDAEKIHKKQQEYWAKVEAEKELKKNKKPEGFFASLFNGKAIKESALGDMPSDQELQIALDSNGSKISVEALKTLIEKLISQSTEESHNKAVRLMNELGFDWQ